MTSGGSGVSDSFILRGGRRSLRSRLGDSCRAGSLAGVAGSGRVIENSSITFGAFSKLYVVPERSFQGYPFQTQHNIGHNGLKLYPGRPALIASVTFRHLGGLLGDGRSPVFSAFCSNRSSTLRNSPRPRLTDLVPGQIHRKTHFQALQS